MGELPGLEYYFALRDTEVVPQRLHLRLTVGRSRRSGWAIPTATNIAFNEVLLPGVGLRYEFTNHDGERIGVVARRTREFELVIYGRNDPDSSRPVMRLNSEELTRWPKFLVLPRMAERFADLTKEVPGLIAGQVEVTAGSPFAGLPLGQTRARTRTGASIVAIVPSDNVIASPTPTDVLPPGDVLVVIGTHDGITGMRKIIHP